MFEALLCGDNHDNDIYIYLVYVIVTILPHIK